MSKIIDVQKEYRDILTCSCFGNNPTKEDEKKMSVNAYGKKNEKDIKEPAPFKKNDLNKCHNCKEEQKLYKRILSIVTTEEEEIK